MGMGGRDGAGGRWVALYPTLYGGFNSTLNVGVEFYAPSAHLSDAVMWMGVQKLGSLTQTLKLCSKIYF